MKKSVQILLSLLLTFLIPMLTSWLLDWEWIAQSWARISLVLLLMLIELAIGAYVFKIIANK
jgi:predicted Na+-dependent transporter